MLKNDLKEDIRKRAFTLGYDRYYDDILVMIEDLFDTGILPTPEDYEELEGRYDAAETEADELRADLKALQQGFDDLLRESEPNHE